MHENDGQKDISENSNTDTNRRNSFSAMSPKSIFKKNIAIINAFYKNCEQHLLLYSHLALRTTSVIKQKNVFLTLNKC